MAIRHQPQYRRDAFCAGLEAAGYQLVARNDRICRSDVLVIWNRYGHWDRRALEYERAGARVIVAENGYMGREWRGGHWYAMSLGRHNGAGWWPAADTGRWRSFGAELEPWRADGAHVLVLLQRGIGVAPVAQPAEWEPMLRRRLPAMTGRPIRWRGHPGEKHPHETLYDDLRDAWCVITWGSGAALKALAAGIPAFYGFPQWIGAGAGLPFGEDIERPRCDDIARAQVFERMAWAMWELREIEDGRAFRLLLRDASEKPDHPADAAVCAGRGWPAGNELQGA